VREDQEVEDASDGAIVPYADVIERADSFEIAADVPGVDESNVVVSIDHLTLTIDATPSPHGDIDERSAIHREFSLLPYRRSFTLPREIDRDGVVAVVRDGVLRVTLRKAPLSKARRITVQTE
jgi:HSP20 family protein